ncbi:unnamed protein product, partial [Rotaria magnacalcarata]
GRGTDNRGKACASLDDLKDKIKERGYEIRKSSLYYRIFGNDCVFFNLTQDTTSKISSGRSLAKGQAPLIMHLYNENSSLESQTTSIATCHRYKPC